MENGFANYVLTEKNIPRILRQESMMHSTTVFTADAFAIIEHPFFSIMDTNVSRVKLSKLEVRASQVSIALFLNPSQKQIHRSYIKIQNFIHKQNYLSKIKRLE